MTLETKLILCLTWLGLSLFTYSSNNWNRLCLKEWLKANSEKPIAYICSTGDVWRGKKLVCTNGVPREYHKYMVTMDQKRYIWHWIGVRSNSVIYGFKIFVFMFHCDLTCNQFSLALLWFQAEHDFSNLNVWFAKYFHNLWQESWKTKTVEHPPPIFLPKKLCGAECSQFYYG